MRHAPRLPAGAVSSQSQNDAFSRYDTADGRGRARADRKGGEDPVKKTKLRRAAALLLTLALLPALPAAAESSVCGRAVDGYTVALAHGAALTETTYWTGGDLRTEHFVTCAPSDALRLSATSWDTLCATGTAEEMETAAGGRRLIAAVNAGYFTFATKEPVGLVVRDGVLRASGDGVYAIGFGADGGVEMGLPRLSMRLVRDGETLAVDALNKGSAKGTVVYTADFFGGKVIGGRNVLCAPSGELRMSGAVTLTVTENTTAAAAVPAGSLLLHSAAEDAPLLSSLAAGDTLTLECVCAPGWETVESAVGYLYPLITDGKIADKLGTDAQPRSAFGLRADGSAVLYTVDGRQSGYSVGLGMAALAQRMAELGCVTAACLDGGGSTDLCAELPGVPGLTRVGRPSGGAPRAVVSYIVLETARTEPGEAASLSLSPFRINAMVGAQELLSVLALDENGLAAPLPEELSFTVEGGVGTVENGVFTAAAPGLGSVTVSAPGLAGATVPVRVVETPDSFALYGEQYGRLTTALTLNAGQEVDLTVRAWSDHVPVLTADTAFTWTLDPLAGTVDGTGHIVPGVDSVTGTLTVSAGELQTTIPITVRGVLPFTDVMSTDPYYEAVKYAYENRIFYGTGETTFSPDTVMDRAMLVTVLWRLSGSPETDYVPSFEDVPAESWYGPAVAWGELTGCVSGYSPAQFGPTDDLTREQILSILLRWSGEEPPPDAGAEFADLADAGVWALDALAWAISPENALIDPDGNGALRPKAPMDRAAVAEVLMRYLTRGARPAEE